MVILPFAAEDGRGGRSTVCSCPYASSGDIPLRARNCLTTNTCFLAKQTVGIRVTNARSTLPFCVAKDVIRRDTSDYSALGLWSGATSSVCTTLPRALFSILRCCQQVPLSSDVEPWGDGAAGAQAEGRTRAPTLAAWSPALLNSSAGDGIKSPNAAWSRGNRVGRVGQRSRSLLFCPRTRLFPARPKLRRRSVAKVKSLGDKREEKRMQILTAG